jgi:UDP-glucose 4-epimerase/UDP-glucuronate decarboxylase
MSKILITGGAGFIGYHLAKRLATQNHDVIIVDKIIPNNKDREFNSLLLFPNVKILEADIADETAWGKIDEGYDFVYHLVSINGFKQFQNIPHEVLRVGLTTTMHALNWFKTKNNKPNAKILYSSSNEVYIGALKAFGTLPLPTPENVPLVVSDTYNPRWSYAGQKLISELLFIHYSKAYNFRMVIVRPHYIYGPRGGYESMIPKIIGRIKSRIDPFPLMGEDDSRSYCYIDDTIEAMIIAMESQKTDGETYNIGSNHKTTIKELTETMFTIMGWRPVKFEIKDSPDGKINHFLPDISKIKRDTGWKEKTSLKDGLKKTIEWYDTNPKNPW